jgi:hypothetical protein
MSQKKPRSELAAWDWVVARKRVARDRDLPAKRKKRSGDTFFFGTAAVSRDAHYITRPHRPRDISHVHPLADHALSLDLKYMRHLYTVCMDAW